MKIETKKNVALILIDIQKGFKNMGYSGLPRNNPNAENNARALLDFFRENALPLFHVQHCSTKPGSLLAHGSAGHAFQEIVEPKEGEEVIQKQVNSAFIGTNLLQRLKEEHIKTVIFAGLTTEHCVSTSARMAANYGFETIVVSDATASFAKYGINNEFYDAELTHLSALAHLRGEFATILTTGKVIEFLTSDRKNQIAAAHTA